MGFNSGFKGLISITKYSMFHDLITAFLPNIE